MFWTSTACVKHVCLHSETYAVWFSTHKRMSICLVYPMHKESVVRCIGKCGYRCCIVSTCGITWVSKILLEAIPIHRA